MNEHFHSQVHNNSTTPLHQHMKACISKLPEHACTHLRLNMAPGPAAFASHLHQRSQSSLSFTILCKELQAYKVNRATHKRHRQSLATLSARLLSPGVAARTSPRRPQGNNKPTKNIKAIPSATPACASESMQSQRRQKLRDRASSHLQPEANTLSKSKHKSCHWQQLEAFILL